MPKPKIGIHIKKRLYFDLEVSPNIGMFWGAGHKISVGYENIIKERAIICICYKWEGEKTVHALWWDKKQDDKEMLKAFIKIAGEADELIGHNGDKFDLAWVRTRCLFHRVPCFPSYTTVDTLKIARSKFRFNSNRLDYIGKFLGLGQKIHTSFGMWTEITLHNNQQELNKMVKYCKGDVKLLEQVYLEMKNHIPAKGHYGVLSGGSRHSCPECGSLNVIKSKTRISASGYKKHQFNCKDCGKYNTIPESALGK